MKKKSLPVTSLLVFLFAFCWVSCSVGEPFADPGPVRDISASRILPSQGTAPAVTVYNPYLLENVRRTAANSGTTRSGDMQATHYYVRFRPATDELHYLVNSEESLICFSYPLDVYAPEGAMCYIDHEQPEDMPQFIFTWVPVDYVFPTGVDYDILGELVLDDDPDEYGGVPEAMKSSWAPSRACS